MQNPNFFDLLRKLFPIRIIGGDRLCLFNIFDFFAIINKFFILKTLFEIFNNYKLSQTLCKKRGVYE